MNHDIAKSTGYRIETAAFNHYEAISRLLAGSGLPVPGAADAPVAMLVALDGAEPFACAGWELYGQNALLRSVAVHPDRKHAGIGEAIVREACHRIASAGASTIYLLTNTAEGFFARLGFTEAARSAVPLDLLGSSSFQGECCGAATAMMRAAEQGPAHAGRPCPLSE